MKNDTQKGKLKRWNDEKGFGFIVPENGGKDIFIHVSALGQIVRRPIVGDVIVYQVQSDTDGKKKAVNAKIEGVAEAKPRPLQRDKRRNSKRSLLSLVMFIALLVILGSFVYNEFVVRNGHHEESLASIPSYVEREKENKKNYSCAGKVYCSEMTSCDEAKFYLRNCPSTKMDGDSDGIPCESQWCNW